MEKIKGIIIGFIACMVIIAGIGIVLGTDPATMSNDELTIPNITVTNVGATNVTVTNITATNITATDVNISNNLNTTNANISGNLTGIVRSYDYFIYNDTGNYKVIDNNGDMTHNGTDFDSALAVTSGKVLMAGNTMYTSGASLPAGISILEGMGENTILYLEDGSNTDVLAGTGFNHITIRNFQINGNNASNSNCNGISLTLLNNSTIANMHIHNCRLKGIALSGCKDNQILNNFINYTDSDGIVLSSQSGGANSMRNLVQGNTINGVHMYGIGIVTPTASDLRPEGEQIINNHITNLTTGNNLNGINVKGADNILIALNTIDTIQNGILFGADTFSSNNSTIVDNIIISATGNSIQLEDAHNVTVSGNKCLLGGSWSVYSDADSSWNMVFDNDIASNPTKIQLNGNNEIARNNKGTSPFDWGNLASSPTPYGKGDKYFNTTNNTLEVYDGSTWQDLW